MAELVVVVRSVSYYGMYFDRELRNRHGAMSLYYRPGQGGILNDRRFGIGDESD